MRPTTFAQLPHTRGLSLTYTLHAKEQMAERDLIIGDINYVLKHGFVHTDAQPSTREKPLQIPDRVPVTEFQQQNGPYCRHSLRRSIIPSGGYRLTDKMMQQNKKFCALDLTLSGRNER